MTASSSCCLCYDSDRYVTDRRTKNAHGIYRNRGYSKSMTKKRENELKAKVAEKKAKRITLSGDLRDLVIDTSRLKNTKSSTEILKELRYQVK